MTEENKKYYKLIKKFFYSHCTKDQYTAPNGKTYRMHHIKLKKLHNWIKNSDNVDIPILVLESFLNEVGFCIDDDSECSYNLRPFDRFISSWEIVEDTYLR